MKTYLFGAGSGLLLMTINIIVAVFLTPYLFNYYGADGFGAISLSMHFFTALALFCSSVSVALSRFYIIDSEKGKGHLDGLLVYSFLVVTILSSLGALTAIVIGQIYIPTINTNISYSSLFYLMALSSILFSFQQVLSIVFYVNHKIYLQNLLQIVSLIVRVLLILLFIVAGLSITSYGVAFLVSTSLTLCFVAYYSNKWRAIKNLKFHSMAKIDTAEFSSVMSWLGVNNFSALLIRNIDLFIIGYYLSGETQGLYALALQWILVIRVFSEALSASISPKIIEISRGSPKQLYENVKLSSKFIGSIVVYPVMFLIVYTSEIWTLWVGEGVVSNFLFIKFLLLSVLFYGCFFPYVYSQVALSKVRVPAITGLIIGVLYILNLIVLGQYELGIEYYSLSLFIAITLKNTIFTVFYGAHITNSQYKSALNPIFRVGAAALFAYYLLLSCGYLFGNSLAGLACSFFVGGIVYVIASYFLVFNKQELAATHLFWKKS